MEKVEKIETFLQYNSWAITFYSNLTEDNGVGVIMIIWNSTKIKDSLENCEKGRIREMKIGNEILYRLVRKSSILCGDSDGNGGGSSASVGHLM